MSKIIATLTDPQLLAAIENNFDEEIACFGRSLPGAELHEEAEISWFRIGPHSPNGVLRTTFTTTNEDSVHSKIQQIIRYFARYKITDISWRIGPTTIPVNLHTYLEAHQFQYRFTTHCLARQISANLPTRKLPIGLSITEVTDQASLRIKNDVERDGFESSRQVGKQYYQTYLFQGFGPGTARQHYIGWLYDKPVAVCALLFYAGVAGIYGVTTLPAARRRGIGAAITIHALYEAQRAGYAIAVLSPTTMSEGIYRRLGFVEYCQLQHYVRSGTAASNENR